MSQLKIMTKRLAIPITLFLGVGVIGFVIGFSTQGSSEIIENPERILGHNLPSIITCIEKIEGVGPESLKEAIAVKSHASGACYDQIRWQGLLNDFQIRRAKFAIQYESEKIILWMVVVLTLSGVLLAGLQLFATYRLAQTGQSGGFDHSHELTVEQGKLVMRSSVTGLFILIFSFAFFYVYIADVFTVKELPTNASTKRQTYPETSYEPGFIPVKGGLHQSTNSVETAMQSKSVPSDDVNKPKKSTGQDETMSSE